MDLKKGLIGFGIGFGATVLAYEMRQKKNMSLRDLTNRMMHATPNGGKIIGTWLSSIPENDPSIHEGAFYRGGVTTMTNYEKIHYAFLIEPKNGEVLKVEQVSN